MTIKIKDAPKRIFSSADIAELMQKVLLRSDKTDRNREHFWTISLDGAHNILNIELVSMGSVRATIVEPMEVFSIPLQKRAVKIVLIHNHPSGHPKPSEHDKDITDRLIQCGNIMQIKVIDHIILGVDDFYSFNDTGLLQQLTAESKYVMARDILDKIESDKQKAISDDRVLMAGKMKSQNFSISKIVKLTGLPRKQIIEL